MIDRSGRRGRSERRPPVALTGGALSPSVPSKSKMTAASDMFVHKSLLVVPIFL
jgi:hypothetical protein